jgi:hypothetical protein
MFTARSATPRPEDRTAVGCRPCCATVSRSGCVRKPTIPLPGLVKSILKVCRRERTPTPTVGREFLVVTVAGIGISVKDSLVISRPTP